jgi:hypothetical protein
MLATPVLALCRCVVACAAAGSSINLKILWANGYWHSISQQAAWELKIPRHHMLATPYTHV